MNTRLTWIKPSLGLLALVVAIAGCAVTPWQPPGGRKPIARAPVVNRNAYRPPAYPARRPAPAAEIGQLPMEDPLLPREYASPSAPTYDPYGDPGAYDASTRPYPTTNDRYQRPDRAPTLSQPAVNDAYQQPDYPPGAAYPPTARVAPSQYDDDDQAMPGVMPEPQPVVPRTPQAAPAPLAVAPVAPVARPPVAPSAPAVALVPPTPAAVAPEPTPEPEPIRPPTRPVSPAAPPADLPPAEISREGNQAVAALLESADQYVKSKQLDKAGAALERALRIEPRNAGIWHDLAQIRLHQGQYQQAESLASKSNNLASDNRALQARNWKMIAVARKAAGNTLGADEAEARAAQLSL